MKQKYTMHEPVLLQEVLSSLKPKVGDSYLDLTAGYGGHAAEVLAITKNYTDAVLVDRDEFAIDELTRRFSGTDLSLVNTDFFSAVQRLASEGRTFDLILADLGVSSPHLDNASRGFSFLREGDLDMRMDIYQELTASTVVNTYSEEKLADMIYAYGEDPLSRRIAKRIVANRPIKNTLELAEIVKACYPGYQKHHPASRTFQAIRIEVNDELGLLKKVLPLLPKLLKPGGRVGIISFHSLEDRIVKQFFREQTEMGYEAEIIQISSNALVASHDEISINPRSRSAKLRVAVKK